MKRILILAMAITLTGCPTPPEEIPQQSGPNNQGGNPPDGNNGMGPAGPPPGQNGGDGTIPPGEGGLPPGDGGPPQGEGPDATPGEGPDAPPGEGPGEGPDATSGEEGQGMPQEEGVGPNGEPIDPANQQATGSEGAPPPPEGDQPPEGQEGQEGQNAETNPEADVANSPPPGNSSQEGTPEGGLIEDSILIKVDRVPPGSSNPQLTQAEIEGGEFITLEGEAICDDCSSTLLLRVNKFLGPNDMPTQTDLITQVKLDSVGNFSIKVPLAEKAITLELLVDEDSNNGPTQGERFAVIELGGALIPSEDRSGLTLNATDREIDNPGLFTP
jgi:hypothetical protein